MDLVKNTVHRRQFVSVSPPRCFELAGKTSISSWTRRGYGGAALRLLDDQIGVEHRNSDNYKTDHTVPQRRRLDIQTYCIEGRTPQKTIPDYR